MNFVDLQKFWAFVNSNGNSWFLKMWALPRHWTIKELASLSIFTLPGFTVQVSS